MQLRISKPKDAIAGSIFLAIGGAAWLGSHDFQIGTATRMGPGYFPQCLGLLLMLLGAISVLRALGTGDRRTREPRALTPLLLILAGVIGFYPADRPRRPGRRDLRADRLRLRAPTTSRPLEVLLIFVVLAAFSVAVFIDGFGMPFRAF